MPLIHFLLSIFLILCTMGARAEQDQSAATAVPLTIGQRAIHIFRAPSGMFSPAERAEAARHRIDDAFERPGEGWTSVNPTEQGLQIELDGQPLFYVLPGDARKLAGETPEDLANQASRVLQKVWSEARERRDPKANIDALLKVSLATVLLLMISTIAVKALSQLRHIVVSRLSGWMTSAAGTYRSGHMARTVPPLVDRLFILLTWLFGMFLAFIFSTYSLGQFVITRPASESLSRAVLSLSSDALTAAAGSVPGLFIAIFIFLFAWVSTRISAQYFANVETRSPEDGWLNTHTAPATRRIVNACLWLFAVAMAYPYLPGSHTEAFKGLSVIVGLMVSIGASGVVGQIASGIILVYTYALKKGEYVRIQDYEGTVTELSLFVTRLRTGLGEEIAIPNALVVGNVTRNFSRIECNRGYMLDTTVTIGYDTPWRQVHAMLVEAAQATPGILSTPPPYVVQTALSDFYVAYKLVTYVGTEVPATRARVASDLHAAIQDAFNRHRVQIMSPHYYRDPSEPKLVPEADWYAPPAQRKES
jgi:small-conductance mechanosensitive channel